MEQREKIYGTRCFEFVGEIQQDVVTQTLEVYLLIEQVNKKKFERKYRDCIKRNGDKIGTQICYDIST